MITSPWIPSQPVNLSKSDCAVAVNALLKEQPEATLMEVVEAKVVSKEVVSLTSFAAKAVAAKAKEEKTDESFIFFFCFSF